MALERVPDPKPSERVAAIIVEQVLPGSRMQYRAEQAHGEHDYDLSLPDRRSAIMEVTEITSPVWRAMSKELANHRLLPRTLCQKDWRVAPELGANIKRIRAHVDEYLAEVEKEGIERFFGPQFRSIPAVVRLRNDLRIMSGAVLALKQPGISLALPTRGGLISDRLAVNAATREAWKDDNRRKLRAGGNGERHLFIWVDRASGEPWMSMTEREPRTAMELPQEVTHLWLATTLAGGEEYLVWTTCATADGHWESLRLPVSG